MSDPRAIAFSPDGRHLYVTGQDSASVAIFERDAAAGRLHQVGSVSNRTHRLPSLALASGVAVSPDGRDVYVSFISSDLTAFLRDTATGELTFFGRWRDGVEGVDGLDYAIAVCVSPNGKRVYVAGSEDHAIAVFARNVETSRLEFLGAVRDTRALHRVRRIAISPDGRHLYAVSMDSGLAVFAVRDAGP